MLQSMHDKIQGLVSWIVAVLIAIIFSLWGVQNYLHGGRDSAAAKVNGEKITQEQLRIAYEQAKHNEMLRLGPNFSFDQKKQAELKKDVLQHLIKREVIFQAANKMGLGVSKRQLWGYVHRQPIFQVDGRFSLSHFHQTVQRMFYSEQAFFNEIENFYLQAQLERGIIGSSFVLPNEIEFLKTIIKQRRDFGYFNVLPSAFFEKIKINDEAIKKYYEQYKNKFLLPEKVSLQYVELTSDNLPKGGSPTSEQLKQFYQNHIDSFSTPKKWQITKVSLPLAVKADSKSIGNAKKKLANIAIELKNKKDLTNVDPEVKIATSWLSRNEASSDIVAQLDKLNIGQVSGVLRTKEGLSLIKVLAKQEPIVTPYEKVIAKVKGMYEQQQLTQAFSEATDRLNDLTYTNPDSLEPAAKELGLKIKVTDLITAAGGKEGILANNKIIKAAFSDPVLKQRYNSNLIDMGSGKIIVLRIKDYMPEKLQPLNEVRNFIMAELRNQEAEKLANKLADELLQAVNSGKTDAELAKQYGLVWYKLSSTKYGDNGVNAKLIDAAFSLEKPKVAKVSATKVNLEKGYAVLRLEKVYDDSSSKDDDKLGNTIKVLPEVLGQFDYQTLMNILMNQAKIEVINKTEDEHL